MKTILVIPDIHHRVNKAQKALDRYYVQNNCDEVVFLGDYFDNFNDTLTDFHITLNWLKQLVDDKTLKKTLLIGNHDMSYISSYHCSGWTKAKQGMYRDFCFDNEFDLRSHYKPSWRCKDIMMTHAGIAKGISLSKQCEAIEDVLDYGVYPECLGAHKHDGGTQNPAGILWNRVRYNRLDDNYFQIFGHTPDLLPDIGRKYVCLDTNSKHCAIVKITDEGKLHGYDIESV